MYLAAADFRRHLALAAVFVGFYVGGCAFLQAPGCKAAPKLVDSAARPERIQSRTTEYDSTTLAGIGSIGMALVASSSMAVQRQARSSRAALRAKVQGVEVGEEAAPPPPPPFDPAKQVGAMAPLGFFDPLGFSKIGDEGGFRSLREAELKHARVAMMAALGAVVQPAVKFPGYESVPAGIGAVTTAPGSYGFAALFALSGVMELFVWTQDPGKEVGDFGNPLGFPFYDEDMRNKELNNGRFAMFSIMGIIAAELVSGKSALQQIG